MQLVIVESPTKAKTIIKFLGKGYSVISSFGHVRDLPQNELGVDIDNNFQPQYIIPAKARPKVKALREENKKAKETILATDEDREGEAIAWHLAEVLKLKKPKRIVFHEITKSAIEQALQNPRVIDSHLVNAQQARRILDRLVGYKLSPFLWKKIMRGLSAGRVQSVAVRLICDRENEIKNFVPAEYWTIVAMFLTAKDIEFQANLATKDGKSLEKLEIKNKAEAERILKDLEKAEYVVTNVERKETKRNPLPPFTTSTLQQTASVKFGFGAQRTMSIAQKLYEKGFITYHRTDSLNLSAQSQSAAKKFIEENLGPKYWPGFVRSFQTKSKSAQEAHEAIRPTYPANAPEQLRNKERLTTEQFKIYDLIWRRFLACQMAQAVFDSCQIDIQAKQYTFRANGQTLQFDGFLKIYPIKYEEAELPDLKKNEVLTLEELIPSQHFTQPPARYSEATLIKKLEQEGIGRPSTYAPILDTIQKRNYVQKDENKKLCPTQTGVMVNEMLIQHFPQIVDIQFTAKMEKELDEIADGKDTWQATLKDFYLPFEKNLKTKEKEVAKKDLIEETDKICPQCKNPIVIRLGRYGRFYACSKFPNCKYTENLPKPSLNIKCPKCGQGEIVEKITRSKKIFYGCSKWPKCDFAVWDKPHSIEINGKLEAELCPRCNSCLVETKPKKVTSKKTNLTSGQKTQGTKCSNKNCDFSI